MQRVIKFRGKTIEGGIWVYGNLNVEFDGTTRICYWYSKLVDEENNCYEPTHTCETVDPETVGQYTERKDCEGKEIYDGDIFEFDPTEWGGNNRLVCRWDNEESAWSWGGGGSADMDWRTVKGNIHDNPELK